MAGRLFTQFCHLLKSLTAKKYFRLYATKQMKAIEPLKAFCSLTLSAYYIVGKAYTRKSVATVGDGFIKICQSHNNRAVMVTKTIFANAKNEYLTNEAVSRPLFLPLRLIFCENANDWILIRYLKRPLCQLDHNQLLVIIWQVV